MPSRKCTVTSILYRALKYAKIRGKAHVGAGSSAIMRSSTLASGSMSHTRSEHYALDAIEETTAPYTGARI